MESKIVVIIQVLNELLIEYAEKSKGNQNDNYKESKMENQNENENYNIENENLKILIKMYKDTEKKYTEEIELLKENILKLEEKNNLFNKIM